MLCLGSPRRVQTSCQYFRFAFLILATWVLFRFLVMVWFIGNTLASGIIFWTKWPLIDLSLLLVYGSWTWLACDWRLRSYVKKRSVRPRMTEVKLWSLHTGTVLCCEFKSGLPKKSLSEIGAFLAVLYLAKFNHVLYFL